MAVHSELAGNVTDRNLVCHLLNLDLLESKELGCADRVDELSLDIVFLASFGGTHDHRCVLLGGNGLEDLLATLVAGVGINLYGRLDIGHADGNTAHSDELSQMLTTYLAHSQGFVTLLTAGSGRGYRLEVEVVSASKRRREEVVRRGRASRVHTLVEELLLDLVGLGTLGKDNIKHIVLESELGRGFRHDLVDCAGQNLDIM